jgi:hypothetical protein
VNSMGLFITCLGVWLIIDGVGSIIEYEKQSTLEQLVRVVRAAVGILLIILGLLLYLGI